MRQVFIDKGLIALRAVCEPVLDDYGVLVQVHYSFISSGTESATLENSKHSIMSNAAHKVKKILESVAINGFDATRALIMGKLKGSVQALGYSASGQVIAVGKCVSAIKVGDFVACAGASYAHHADIIYVPEHLVARLNGQEMVKAASITTIGAIALQGVRRAQLQLGETVCVIGLGLLGQLTVQLAVRSGCNVIGIDVMDERLALAHELGAYKVFNATDQNCVNSVLFATEHFGVDATIITAASKSDSIVQQAMEITRKKGKVVVVGDVGLHINRDPFYKKEIDFLISCSYGPGRYDVAYEQQGKDYPYAYVRWTEQRNMQMFVDLIEQKAVSIERLVDKEVSIDDVEHAYEQLNNKSVLGIMLNYTNYQGKQCPQRKSKVTQQPQFIPATTDSLRVGVIGAGGFAKIKLMPILARINNIHISAVVDPDAANALNVSRQYNARFSLRDDKALFEQDMVDAVVIASPHVHHAEQALKALRSGKAVFLEKPMVTTGEQYQQLYDYLQENPQARFCVDYNRSFAPFVQKIKEAISERSTPLMIHYRMNAGFIPKEHWVQSHVGAGRIIGEACHIIDLFYYLTNANPLSVSVESLGGLRSDLLSTDNASIQIRFDDGSVCSLLYTSLGSSIMGKERMELFFDGKSIVMEDYINLRGYGLKHSFDQTVRSPDKGHELLMKKFFEEVRKEVFAPPINFNRLNRVAQMTLIIDQLAAQGGGEREL